MEIAKAKGRTTIHGVPRSSAVNMMPTHTIELRYPRGGSTGKEIRKNIEWADTLYRFSQLITVKEVKGGALNDAGYLFGWIKEQPYDALNEWLDERLVTPKSFTDLGS